MCHGPQKHSGRVSALSAKGPGFNPGSGIYSFYLYPTLPDKHHLSKFVEKGRELFYIEIEF